MAVEAGVPSTGVPVGVESDPRDKLGRRDDSESCERWPGVKVALAGMGAVEGAEGAVRVTLPTFELAGEWEKPDREV